MAKRHHDALAIWAGAVNPAGMARSLVSACDEAIAESVQQRTDPAIRLITAQIAYIVGVWDGVSDPIFDSYETQRKLCELAIAKEPKKEGLSS